MSEQDKGATLSGRAVVNGASDESPPQAASIPSAQPVRIQLSRRKGWKMPPNSKKVDRSTYWGNPFRVGEPKLYVNDADPSDRVWFNPQSVAETVEAFRWMVSQPDRVRRIRKELVGKNLACWCPLDAPCHADVLLELANAQGGEARQGGDGEAGSVHEHPVANGDAPTTRQGDRDNG